MGKRSIKGLMFVVPLLVSLGAGASRAIADEGGGHLAAVLSWQGIVSTVVYGLIGMVLAFVGYKLYSLVVPFDLNKELAEDDNPAVGIVAGSVILGVSIIVAAAIV